MEERTLDQVRTLDRFLVSVEKRAFRIARIAVRHDDDALDIVQDAMLQLARAAQRGMAAAVLLRSAKQDPRLSAPPQGARQAHEQTASAMGCSEGSVKTHYSRAVHTLREQLVAAW